MERDRRKKERDGVICGFAVSSCTAKTRPDEPAPPDRNGPYVYCASHSVGLRRSRPPFVTVH
jgi:hypothetical protein